MARKDKYACFQWIRDVRAKMNEEMEHMTPEERVAYIHAGAQEALRGLPKLSLEEARRRRHAILHPEDATVPPPKATTPRLRKGKAKAAAKPAGRRKAADRLARV